MPFEALKRLDSRAHVIPGANIDTDVIYPARFLLVLDRDGIGQYAFRDWRLNPDGTAREDFPATALGDDDRSILLAGPNFGCGSSREHAVWTLADLGIRCVIAPGFGEIFYSNCFKNGVLPLALPEAQWLMLKDAAERGEELHLDLEAQRIAAGTDEALAFSVPEQQRQALLNGWDEIDRLLAEDGEHIRAFEERRRDALPWLFTDLG